MEAESGARAKMTVGDVDVLKDPPWRGHLNDKGGGGYHRVKGGIQVLSPYSP